LTQHKLRRINVIEIKQCHWAKADNKTAKILMYKTKPQFID